MSTSCIEEVVLSQLLGSHATACMLVSKINPAPLFFPILRKKIFDVVFLSLGSSLPAETFSSHLSVEPPLLNHLLFLIQKTIYNLKSNLLVPTGDHSSHRISSCN